MEMVKASQSAWYCLVEVEGPELNKNIIQLSPFFLSKNLLTKLFGRRSCKDH